VPFLKEEAKVFLDRDCLLDGQSWLTGFVQGSNPNPKPKATHQKPQILNPELSPRFNPKLTTSIPNPKPHTRSLEP
jgi:hypothetical protein